MGLWPLGGGDAAFDLPFPLAVEWGAVVNVDPDATGISQALPASSLLDEMSIISAVGTLDPLAELALLLILPKLNSSWNCFHGFLPCPSF